MTVNWTASGELPVHYFEIKSDDGNWEYVGTQTSYNLTGLNNGTHSFTVRVVGGCGEHAEASVSYTIEFVEEEEEEEEEGDRTLAERVTDPLIVGSAIGVGVLCVMVYLVYWRRR